MIIPSHHIVELVVPLCAQLMAVMARDTGDGDGPVRKYRLIKVFATFGNDSRIGLPGILCHRFQTRSFELIRRPVFVCKSAPGWPTGYEARVRAPESLDQPSVAFEPEEAMSSLAFQSSAATVDLEILQPIHDMGGIDGPIGLNDRMNVLCHHFRWNSAVSPACATSTATLASMMAQSPPRIRPAVFSIMANLFISSLRQKLLQKSTSSSGSLHLSPPISIASPDSLDSANRPSQVSKSGYLDDGFACSIKISPRMVSSVNFPWILHQK